MGEEYKSNEELLIRLKELMTNVDYDNKIFNNSITKIDEYLSNTNLESSLTNEKEKIEMYINKQNNKYYNNISDNKKTTR